MKKLLTIVVLLVAVFIFRTRLIDLSTVLFVHEESQSEWVVRTRNGIYDKIQGLEFKPSLLLLKDYTHRLQKESGKYKNADQHKKVHRRYVICELAIVHKKTAMLHLQNGSYEQYIEYMQKYRDQIAECVSLQKNEMVE